MNCSVSRYKAVPQPAYPILEPVSRPVKHQVRWLLGVALSVYTKDRSHHPPIRSQHSRGVRRVAQPSPVAQPSRTRWRHRPQPVQDRGAAGAPQPAGGHPAVRPATASRRHPHRPQPRFQVFPSRPEPPETQQRCCCPRAAPAYGAAREARSAPTPCPPAAARPDARAAPRSISEPHGRRAGRGHTPFVM